MTYLTEHSCCPCHAGAPPVNATEIAEWLHRNDFSIAAIIGQLSSGG